MLETKAPPCLAAAVIGPATRSPSRIKSSVVQMLDRDVRLAAHVLLNERHAHESATTRVFDEFGICGEVRIDIAVLNGRFEGYELKSNADNLNRLPKQVEIYSKVLDSVHLVVGDHHVSAALNIVPNWWGVIIATSESSGVVGLHELRTPGDNPDVKALELSLLLWNGELLSQLESRQLAHGVRSKPRRVLAQRLAENVGLDEIRDTVRETIKAREHWRPDR